MNQKSIMLAQKRQKHLRDVIDDSRTYSSFCVKCTIKPQYIKEIMHFIKTGEWVSFHEQDQYICNWIDFLKTTHAKQIQEHKESIKQMKYTPNIVNMNVNKLQQTIANKLILEHIRRYETIPNGVSSKFGCYCHLNGLTFSFAGKMKNKYNEVDNFMGLVINNISSKILYSSFDVEID